jgi:hypothetical protein
MDEDAEKGLSFMLNHCPLETLLMHNVAICGDLSTFSVHGEGLKRCPVCGT